MPDFDALLSEGFAAMLDTVGNCTFTHEGFTAKGISSSISESNELRTTGYWLAFQCVLEITRADFLKLKVVSEKSVGTYVSSDGARNFSARVTAIDGAADDGDPCVRLTLRREADAVPGQPAPER